MSQGLTVGFPYTSWPPGDQQPEEYLCFVELLWSDLRFIDFGVIVEENHPKDMKILPDPTSKLVDLWGSMFLSLRFNRYSLPREATNFMASKFVHSTGSVSHNWVPQRPSFSILGSQPYLGNSRRHVRQELSLHSRCGQVGPADPWQFAMVDGVICWDLY